LHDFTTFGTGAIGGAAVLFVSEGVGYDKRSASGLHRTEAASGAEQRLLPTRRGAEPGGAGPGKKDPSVHGSQGGADHQQVLVGRSVPVRIAAVVQGAEHRRPRL